MTRRSRRSPYHPRYWPTWMGLGLLWLNARLVPYPLALAMGKILGKTGYLLARRRRHIAAVNISLCFPELSPQAQRDMVREHFVALGISLLMLGFSWWASDRKLQPLLHIKGLEHLDAALNKGQGVILLGLHFTDLDIIGRLLSRHHWIATMYRRNENPVIEMAFRRNRQRRFAAAIHRGDMRAMLRVLKENIPVWYAADQSMKGKNSALVPFFGVPASTNTATSRIARISKAPVMMFFGYRLPGTEGFQIICQPPLENFPTCDVEADTACINQMVEKAVRFAPPQYLWIHRRFKKRKVLPDPY